MNTRTAAAVLAGLLLTTLTACGSSDDDAATTTPSTVATDTATSAAEKPADDAAALQAAVRAYSNAYFKPDADAAYSALSKRCQGKTDKVMFASAVEAGAASYGQQSITNLTVDQQSGDLARVTYTYSVPKLNQAQQPWARENGQWHYDAC